MKKLFGFIFKLVLFVAVLAGIGTGAYFWIGIQVQENFKKDLKAIIENSTTSVQLYPESPMKLVVNVTEYNKGIFKSTAKSEISLQPNNSKSSPLGGAMKLKVILDHEISHGPFIIEDPKKILESLTPYAAVIKTSLNKKSEDDYKTILSFMLRGEKVDKLPKFNAVTFSSFGGPSETQLNISPLQYSSNEMLKEETVWNGLKGWFYANFEDGSFNSNVNVGGFIYKNKDGFVKIDGIKFNFIGSFDPAKFSKGESTMQIGEITFDGNNSLLKLPDIKAKDLKISQKTSLSSNGIVNLDIESSYKSIHAENITNLDNGHLNIKIGNLKYDAVKPFIQSRKPPRQKDVLKKFLKLKQKPAISFSGASDIEIASQKDKVNFDVSVKLQGDVSDKEIKKSLDEALQKVIIANTKISVPKDLFIESVLKEIPIIKRMAAAKASTHEEGETEAEQATTSSDPLADFINNKLAFLIEKQLITESGRNINFSAKVKKGKIKIGNKEWNEKQLNNLFMEFMTN